RFSRDWSSDVCSSDLSAWRDARIARIYEGTNEINRMLCVGMLVKKAMKGHVDLLTPAMQVASELTSIPDFSTPDYSELFAEEKRSEERRVGKECRSRE